MKKIIFILLIFPVILLGQSTAPTDCDQCDTDYDEAVPIQIAGFTIYYHFKKCNVEFDFYISKIEYPDNTTYSDDELKYLLQSIIQEIASQSLQIGNNHQYSGNYFRIIYPLCADFIDQTPNDGKKDITFCEGSCCYIDYDAYQDQDCVKVNWNIGSFRGTKTCNSDEQGQGSCFYICDFNEIIK